MNAQLTVQQNKRISGYLKKRGIADEGLLLEMGDYIKNLVISRLNTGNNFEAAFSSALSAVKARESLTGFPGPSYKCSNTVRADKMLPAVLAIISTMILLTGCYLQYYRLPFGKVLLISGGILLTGACLLAVVNFLIPVMISAYQERQMRKNSMISN